MLAVTDRRPVIWLSAVGHFDPIAGHFALVPGVCLVFPTSSAAWMGPGG